MIPERRFVASVRPVIVALALVGALVFPGPRADSLDCTGVEVARYGYQVVNSYPHDPRAFTQGLAFGDGHLYESTGRFGQSSLRRVELETGVVLQRLDLPAHLFGEGIALVEGEIYANVWHGYDVLRIAPDTGCVVGRIDLSGVIDPGVLTDPEAVLNGIAYDEGERRLFVTGKLWPKVFQIRVTRPRDRVGLAK